MASLPAGPVLVLDAAGATVRVGLLGAPGGDRWRDSDGEALVALFAATRDLLDAAGLTVADIEGFVLCRGPGSVLGLRVAALAVATWVPPGADCRPVLGYRSLDAVALAAAQAGVLPPFTVCADFKEGRWVRLRVATAGDVGTVLPYDTVAADEPVAPTGETVLYLPMRKRWRPPPDGALEFTPSTEQLGAALRSPGWLRTIEPTDLDLGPPPTYRTWSGDRHRASIPAPPP